MSAPLQTPRRQRGVILTARGGQRFEAAQVRLETDANDGRLSLERLGLAAGLSTKTLSRVINRAVPVDIRTLQLLFAALRIDLQNADYSAARTFCRQQTVPEVRSAFIGRTAELARLRVLWQNHRVVTLTGAGGVGKTRLALEAVVRYGHESFSRTAYCDLALANDPTLAAAKIIAASGKPQNRLERTLLVLDNCEQVLERTGAVIDKLLDARKLLVVLATSREALGIDGEAVIRVAPFALPAPAAQRNAALALRNDAVALFVDRARCADDLFRFDADAVRYTTEIVSHVQGMPLAIEIAASRVPTTGLAEISESLLDRRRALVSESATHPPRHRSARATIDSSFTLLDESERRIFRRLAVLGNSFDTNAARGIISDEAIDVSAVIGRFVSKSLLFVESGHVPTRYWMLDTVREYAARQLNEASTRVYGLRG